MLWPFSTMGWPSKTKELEYFYPTNVLSTAPEILFFWVARMIIAGLYFMDDIPYSEVYLHSTVRDKLGRKMSKSLGNGIDPLEVIDKHGADALRFTIISLAPMGLDIKLSFSDKENDFLVGTRFANKIWNASRYILMNIKSQTKPIDKECLTLADKWILTNLNKIISKSDSYLSSYRFNDFAMALYGFIWHDFCDWYIELSKINLYGGSVKEKENTISILVYVLSESLKLLHPLMPFITEEIWQKLSHDGDSIMVSSYPKADDSHVYHEAEKAMALVKELVYSIRNIRGEMNIPPDKKVNIIIKAVNPDMKHLLSDYGKYINSLAKVGSIDIKNEFKMDSGCASSVGSGYELYIPLKGLIDIEKEKDRAIKEIKKLEKELDRSNKKLQNKNFIEKAQPTIIQKERDKLKEFSINLDKLKHNLSLLD
jgi:valyl-tRNA synthetase